MLELAQGNFLRGNMPVPPRKPGEKEYRVSYDRDTDIATVTLFAKDEAAAKKTFKTYVGKYPIRRVREM